MRDSSNFTCLVAWNKPKLLDHSVDYFGEERVHTLEQRQINLSGLSDMLNISHLQQVFTPPFLKCVGSPSLLLQNK